MKKLKIEAGKFYKTRDGRKAGIYRTDVNHYADTIHGYIIGSNRFEYSEVWRSDGKYMSTDEHGYDLISEWQEPLDFDWDCLPHWCNKYIAMDKNGSWTAYSNKAKQGALCFYNYDTTEIVIPIEHLPKNFKGNWEDSLFKNPNLD